MQFTKLPIYSSTPEHVANTCMQFTCTADKMSLAKRRLLSRLFLFATARGRTGAELQCLPLTSHAWKPQCMESTYPDIGMPPFAYFKEIVTKGTFVLPLNILELRSTPGVSTQSRQRKLRMYWPVFRWLSNSFLFTVLNASRLTLLVHRSRSRPDR